MNWLLPRRGSFSCVLFEEMPVSSDDFVTSDDHVLSSVESKIKDFTGFVPLLCLGVLDADESLWTE